MSALVDERAAGDTGRLVSLDVFRGLTIAAMVLVNNPGGAPVYAPLDHAEWHGWTPTDFIFPFFLFIVGVSITLSFARRVETGKGGRALWLSVMRRAAVIFGLGLLIHGFPYYNPQGVLRVYNLSVIRIPGVLQRIAVCYLFASLIFLKTTWRTQSAIIVALLLGYWLLMTLTPVPGYGMGDLSKEGNLAAYVDRSLLSGHMYTKIYDPEGVLSTIPAIATTLIGILAGHWLRRKQTPLEKVAGMFVAGVTCIVAGWIWNSWFPINKALWTSSYVLFTAGMALQLLAVCYWLIEIKNYRAWAKPFVIFGVNAIALFVGSALLARLMNLWRLPRMNGQLGTSKTYIYEHLFLSWAAPINASLFYALAYLLVWLGLMTLLYRKKIFIKV
ncbi:MAG: acyltransferase family protein [Pyrinomonadaceae bacterium]